MDDDFREFAAAQTRPLLGLAHALTANPHDAWDLTQETLARLGERWGRTRFEEPAAYARTVMVRLNIDRIRRLRRERDAKGGIVQGRHDARPPIGGRLFDQAREVGDTLRHGEAADRPHRLLTCAGVNPRADRVRDDEPEQQDQ